MPKARFHKCVIPICRAEIPEWLHFCKKDYALVPKYLKDQLHDEWIYMKREGIRHTQRQGEIIREAIAAVMEKRQKNAEKRRKSGGDLLAQPGGAA